MLIDIEDSDMHSGIREKACPGHKKKYFDQYSDLFYRQELCVLYKTMDEYILWVDLAS